jgi:hypothetical protein
MLASGRRHSLIEAAKVDIGVYSHLCSEVEYITRITDQEVNSACCFEDLLASGAAKRPLTQS